MNGLIRKVFIQKCFNFKKTAVKLDSKNPKFFFFLNNLNLFLLIYTLCRTWQAVILVNTLFDIPALQTGAIYIYLIIFL